MALEKIAGYTKKWLNFAANHKNITLEIRTKSNNYDLINDIKPIPNVILSWTLSPQSVISNYEINTPSLDKRLISIKNALSSNWNIRLCIDPIIMLDNWKPEYKNLINKIHNTINISSFQDISLGAFRMPKKYLQNIRSNNTQCKLSYYNYDIVDDIAIYKEEYELISHVKECINNISRDISIHF